MQNLDVIEFNIIKNCNLNCKGCNHFSNLTKKKEIIDIKTVKNDLKRLHDLNIKINKINLLGGEPLLLNNLEEYVIACHNIYPNTQITIFTNGLLIYKISEKLQNVLEQHNVLLKISLYPMKQKQQLKKQIKNHLKNKKIKYIFLIYKNKFRKQLSTEIHTDNLKKYCLCGVPTIENGKLYNCPISAFISKLNNEYNYNFPDNEFVDIYDKNVNINKIYNTQYKAIELCKYCCPKNITSYKWKGNYKAHAKFNDWVIEQSEKRTPSYHFKMKLAVTIDKMKIKIFKLFNINK